MTRTHNSPHTHAVVNREALIIHHNMLHALIQKTTVIRGALADCEPISETHQETSKNNEQSK
jgi:hypothetical protein